MSRFFSRPFVAAPKPLVPILASTYFVAAVDCWLGTIEQIFASFDGLLLSKLAAFVSGTSIPGGLALAEMSDGVTVVAVEDVVVAAVVGVVVVVGLTYIFLSTTL